MSLINEILINIYTLWQIINIIIILLISLTECVYPASQLVKEKSSPYGHRLGKKDRKDDIDDDGDDQEEEKLLQKKDWVQDKSSQF